MNLLNEAVPGLGDGGGISEIGDMVDQEAEIVIASLISVTVKELIENC